MLLIINRRISVFQTDDKFLHTIGSKQLEYPNDVAVNNNNQLLVTDYDHHCIYTFTLDGDYVGKLGTYGAGGVNSIILMALLLICMTSS